MKYIRIQLETPLLMQQEHIIKMICKKKHTNFVNSKNAQKNDKFKYADSQRKTFIFSLIKLKELESKKNTYILNIIKSYPHHISIILLFLKKISP